MYLIFYNLMKREMFKKYLRYTLKYDGCLKKKHVDSCLSCELNEQLFSETAIFTWFGDESSFFRHEYLAETFSTMNQWDCHFKENNWQFCCQG